MKEKIKNYIANPLLSGSVLMIGGSMVINVINYLYHLIMGRILGPVNYGELSSIYSLLYIITVVPVSSSFAIVKFISSAKTEEEKVSVYQSVKSWINKIGIVIWLLIVLLSPIIKNFLNLSEVTSVILVGPILWLSLITLVNQSAAQSVLKFWGVVGPNLVSSLIKLIFGVIAVWIGLQTVGAIGAVLISLFFAFLLSKKTLPTYFVNIKTVGHLNLGIFFKYALPVLVQSIAFTSLFTTDLILVKHFFSPTEAGWYAALSILGKIIYFAAAPVIAVMFPMISHHIVMGKKYRLIFLSSLFLVSGISSSILLIYYFFPDLSITLLYGSKYLAIKSELIWMGMFMTLYNVDSLLVNFNLSIGKTKIVIIPTIGAITQIIAINIWHWNLHQVVLASTIIMLGMLPILSLWKTK